MSATRRNLLIFHFRLSESSLLAIPVPAPARPRHTSFPPPNPRPPVPPPAKKMKSILLPLSLLGLTLSLYALHVEHTLLTTPTFTSLCDLTIPILEVTASCSKTLSSPESHLLSFFNLVPEDSPVYLNPPNALLGVIFYILTFLSTFTSSVLPLLKPLTYISIVVSVYLLSVLIEKGDVCLLCLSTHAINAVIFYGINFTKDYKLKVK